MHIPSHPSREMEVIVHRSERRPGSEIAVQRGVPHPKRERIVDHLHLQPFLLGGEGNASLFLARLRANCRRRDNAQHCSQTGKNGGTKHENRISPAELIRNHRQPAVIESSAEVIEQRSHATRAGERRLPARGGVAEPPFHSPRSLIAWTDTPKCRASPPHSSPAISY
jgi:hypothetical protein